MKGWGPKSSVCPSKHRKTKHFGRISQDFAGISEGRPKNLRKNCSCSISGPCSMTYPMQFPPPPHWTAVRSRVKMEPFALFSRFSPVLEPFLVQFEANPCSEAGCGLSCWVFLCFAGVSAALGVLEPKFTICPFRPPQWPCLRSKITTLDGRKRAFKKRTRACQNARFKNTSVSKWFLGPLLSNGRQRVCAF